LKGFSREVTKSRNSDFLLRQVILSSSHTALVHRLFNDYASF